MGRHLLVTALLMLLPTTPARADSVAVNVLAATGLQVPGEAPGVTYEIDTGSAAGLYAAASHQGDAAYVFDLRGPGMEKLVNDQALFFRSADGAVTKVAQRGGQAAGTPPGAQWYLFKLGGVADDGTVGFRAELNHVSGGGGVSKANDKALYTWSEQAGHALLAREGSAAPGAEEYLLWPFDGWFLPPAMVPRVTAGGLLAFSYPLLVGNEAAEALFAPDDGGALYPVAYEGLVVPGLAGGELYAGLGKGVAINDSGQLVFRASLGKGPGGAEVLAANDTVMVGPGVGGGLTVLAREGDPVPGLAGATWYNFENLDQFTIANDGRVAWSELITVGGKNYDCIVQSTAEGTPEVVVMAGDSAAGFDDVGGTYGTFSHVARASNGSIGWFGQVEVPGDSVKALFLRSPEGIVDLVMRTGDPVPGVDGSVYGWPETFLNVNANGQVLYFATVYIVESFSSFTGAFLYTPGKGSMLLLAGGDKVTAAPGDVRTVKYFKLPEIHPAGGADADGRILPLTNAGEVFLSVTFVEPSSDPTHTINAGLVHVEVLPGSACDNLDCNDDDACTIDDCDLESGCVHTPVDCDDGDPCTKDSCDPTDGECSHEAIPGGTRCEGDDWVLVDVCDQVLSVQESCANGCADDGCCPEGTWADNGLCVSDPVIDEGPDVVSIEDEPEIVTIDEGPEIVSIDEGPEIVTIDDGPEVVSIDEGPEVVFVDEGPEVLAEVVTEKEVLAEVLEPDTGVDAGDSSQPAKEVVELLPDGSTDSAGPASDAVLLGDDAEVGSGAKESIEEPRSKSSGCRTTPTPGAPLWPFFGVLLLVVVRIRYSLRRNS